MEVPPYRIPIQWQPLSGVTSMISTGGSEARSKEEEEKNKGDESIAERDRRAKLERRSKFNRLLLGVLGLCVGLAAVGFGGWNEYAAQGCLEVADLNLRRFRDLISLRKKNIIKDNVNEIRCVPDATYEGKLVHGICPM
ncbi:hypothetical protein GUITHDRAFT_141305 [Guillardia theta CCMP2712]|uniref:Uncharacterized protein n=1 Tax=Guillardia theta (strain CCMP2712) TaxID=905079 RepID=L1J243_GUITC|nr:hypothetical protein GUITHDRAFT_141305 [Guillardia theta CCMP2712]EKX42357.1 hypothetical protein GUITHDRAFT_141305 [Guillardia theta CCMP2712]|eukprot:XP_005829337.1 hypothetical protein GUITHDRAFT_141305 [Guillardia theta CCMP2712]